MKKCTKCLKVKELECFGKDKSTKDGLKCVCKDCKKQYRIDHREEIKQYHQSKLGLCKRIYINQIYRSKKRNHPKPEYSEKWLIDFILNNPNFESLYNKWVESNYNKTLTPSIDRKDNDLSYLKNNIQLMTWRENNEKGRIEHSKLITQFSKDMKFIFQFKSAREAERITGIHNSNISQCCHNIRKSAGGFIWKFA